MQPEIAPADVPIEEPLDTIIENPSNESETVETPEATPQIDVASVELDAITLLQNGAIQLVSGQPDRLPILRSGRAIPEPVPEDQEDQTTENTEVDPAIAEANALRPRRRPQAVIDLEAPINPMLSDAAPAIAQRPDHRNSGSEANAARIAEIARDRPRAVAPRVPADPQTVNLPTSASVQRAATIENGINLRKTSLIGIFGTADARDVLIRLASGRILQVGLGDSFSGWRVVAISDDSIRIQKGNRTEILRMPN